MSLLASTAIAQQTAGLAAPNPLAAVDVATTANITLSGEQTIDGTLTSTSRVLVPFQTDASKNGVYVTAAGAWTRATDANTAAKLAYASVYVLGGTANAGTEWRSQSDDSITLNTDDINFVLTLNASAFESRVAAVEADLAIAESDIDDLEALTSYNPGLTYAPAPVHQFDRTAASSNITFNAVTKRWSRSTGTGSFYTETELTPVQKAWTTVEVRLPVTGTFSVTPYAQLLDASRVQIGSNFTGTLDSDAGEYVMSVTLSGSPDAIRVRWSTTSDGESGWPYFIEGGASLVALSAASGFSDVIIDDWHTELFKRSGNIYGGAPSADNWSAVIGSAPVVGADGRTVDIASGAVSTVVVPAFGMFDASDYAALLFRMHEPSSTFKLLYLAGGDYINANKSFDEQKLYQDGEYFIAFVKAQDSTGAAAKTFEMRVDTRASGVVPATAVKLEMIGLFNLPDETWVERIFADPVRLMENLAEWEQTPAWVSADGEGERIYADLAKAVRSGHKTVYCGETQRLSSGLLIAGEDRSIIMENGAAIRFSEELDISDFAATSADANVYYRADTFDAEEMWEIDGDSIARMQAANPTGNELYTLTANEAAVQATAGTYWYGAGSEGTGDYIRPFGDATAGKTFERPMSEYGLIVPPQSSLTVIQDASARSGFTSKKAVIVWDRLTLEGGRWGYTPNPRDFISPEPYSNAIVTLENCLITEAGNDGYNSGPFDGYTNTLCLNNARFEQHWNDGVALGHQDGRDVVYASGRIETSNNGKQGFVSIGLVDLDAATWVSRNNRSTDFLVQHSKAGDQEINIAWADIDTVAISLTGSAAATGRMVGVIDTISDADGLTILQVTAA